MKLNRTGAALIGGVVALVLGSGTAYAATGGTFVLGRANKATTLTTLTNTAGTPLSLVGKTGAAPLKVASSTKVANLNADKLDGLDSKTFLRATGKAANADKLDGLDSSAFARIAPDSMGSVGYGADLADGEDWDRDGSTDVVAVAGCPAGYLLTGGGYDLTNPDPNVPGSAAGPVLRSAADESGNYWLVVVHSTDAAADAPFVGAYATCYNPRGAFVAPAGAAVAALQPLKAERRVAQRLAR
jgi:hypothetical protein